MGLSSVPRVDPRVARSLAEYAVIYQEWLLVLKGRLQQQAVELPEELFGEEPDQELIRFALCYHLLQVVGRGNGWGAGARGQVLRGMAVFKAARRGVGCERCGRWEVLLSSATGTWEGQWVGSRGAGADTEGSGSIQGGEERRLGARGGGRWEVLLPPARGSWEGLGGATGGEQGRGAGIEGTAISKAGWRGVGCERGGGWEVGGFAATCYRYLGLAGLGMGGQQGGGGGALRGLTTIRRKGEGLGYLGRGGMGWKDFAAISCR